ncbi:MAG: tetratricopeptide repeat protein [Bacteroidetes bacterium]|nr:tetratricopeptide repeat protein [Bacteroidota bacterium]
MDSLLVELQKSGDDTNRVKRLNDVGGYLINEHEHEKALVYLELGIQLAEKLEYKQGVCVALNRMGISYLNKSDYVKARSYFEKAIIVARQAGDKKSEADIMSNLGIILCDQGEYPKALGNYLNALKIREEINDKRGITSSKMSLANVYYLQGRHDMALKSYLDIEKAKGFGEDEYLHAKLLYNIGLTCYQLKDYSTALNYFNAALKIDEKINDKQGVALIYTNLGAIYSSQKNYKKALELLWKGCTILTELGDKRGAAEAYSDIGVIYDSLKQPPKALECYTRQLELSKELNSKVNIKKAYLFMSNHYEARNNFKEAHAYYKLYKLMEDSIKNESSIKSIAELEARYENQKKEKEIGLLKAGQEVQNAENKRQKQLFYSIFILAVVMGLFGFLLYNRQQIKKKSALERRNFELERNALALQMDPHFIFNSLGSISGFISENDKDKAIEYLGVFSRLIRYNLEQSREQFVSVQQEAKMLNSYLFLQQLRYNDKFTFEITTDPEIDSSMAIPPMFVQPFVENSILHGIVPKSEKGHVWVRFYVHNDEHLVCEVTDDGIGRVESMNRKTGFGQTHRSLAMKITEERTEIINSMNKEKIMIATNDRLNEKQEITGTIVTLRFPLDYV